MLRATRLASIVENAAPFTATRSFVGSYRRYGQWVADWDEDLSLPAHIEVAVGDIHSAPEASGFFTVNATVSSAERSDWAIAGELPMVVEDGQVRVCDGGLRLD